MWPTTTWQQIRKWQTYENHEHRIIEISKNKLEHEADTYFYVFLCVELVTVFSLNIILRVSFCPDSDRGKTAVGKKKRRPDRQYLTHILLLELFRQYRKQHFEKSRFGRAGSKVRCGDVLMASFYPLFKIH